jgi:hypothetical protein
MAPVNAPSRGQTTRFQEGPKEWPHSSLYKRLTLAEAPVVNGASDHLLAGSRLALDEYRRVCRCNNSNWEDAEDVVQESLLKAFKHLGQFRGTCSFVQFLIVAYKNCNQFGTHADAEEASALRNFIR